MRYVISGLLAGLLVGVLAPIPFVFGSHSCGNVVDNDHSSQFTCCQCGYEDHTVDYIKNDSTGGEFCMEVENCSWCHETNDPQIAPTPCQNHDPNDNVQYTVSVDRDDPCVPTHFFTDVRVHGTDCNDFHGHTFTTQCGAGCP